MMHTLLSIGLFLLSILSVGTASAQGIVSGGANDVAGGLFSGFGSGGFLGIVEVIMGQVRLIIVAIGILIVVRSGLKLINSQDEGKLDTAKRTIASTCVGIMLAFMAERLVGAFYAPGGTWDAGTATAGANILSQEIGGIVDWALVIVIVLSILMIVASGIKAIGSFGKEENATEVRQTVVGVMTGLGLILLSTVIKLTLGLSAGVTPAIPGAPDANIIIVRVTNIAIAALQYLAIIAIAIIIYAGLLMVLNFGKDDQYEKAKGIIYRAMIGLAVVLFSVVIARFVVNLFI